MDDEEVTSMFHVKHAKGIQGMTEGGGRADSVGVEAGGSFGRCDATASARRGGLRGRPSCREAQLRQSIFHVKHAVRRR